jgi:hypothetical protein
LQREGWRRQIKRIGRAGKQAGGRTGQKCESLFARPLLLLLTVPALLLLLLLLLPPYFLSKESGKREIKIRGALETF